MTDDIIGRLKDAIDRETGYRPFQDGPNRQLLCDALSEISNLRKVNIIITLITAIYKFPHLRIGQLIINVISDDTDLFYISDDNLVLQINEFIEKHGK